MNDVTMDIIVKIDIQMIVMFLVVLQLDFLDIWPSLYGSISMLLDLIPLYN